MNGKNLPESDNQIISLIAEEKEYRQYDMPKRLNKAYRTIMRRVRELENNGLIRVARKEPSEKRGKRAKVYMLTIKGVLTYLSSVSIKPIKLFVIGGKSEEEVRNTVEKDIRRYSKEVTKLAEFLKFYGEKLDFVIFKEIQWLMQNFQMKTENWAISLILDKAKLTVSNFSTHTGLSQYAENRKKERDHLKKEIIALQKIPIGLRKIKLTTWFGSMSKPIGKSEKEIDIDLEVKRKFKYAEEELRFARQIENKNWKTFFTEQFYREIGGFSKKENLPNASLYKDAAILLTLKKKNEISPLERTLELFNVNSVKEEEKN